MKMRPMLENPPENQRNAVADLFQWILFQEPVAELLHRSVNARYMAKSLEDLAKTSFAPDAQACEVRLAWQVLSDVMGPQLLWMFVGSGAWKRYCPRVSRRHDSLSKFALWAGGGEKVVARVQYWREEPVDLRFFVESL